MRRRLRVAEKFSVPPVYARALTHYIPDHSPGRLMRPADNNAIITANNITGGMIAVRRGMRPGRLLSLALARVEWRSGTPVYAQFGTAKCTCIAQHPAPAWVFVAIQREFGSGSNLCKSSSILMQCEGKNLA